MEQQQPLTGGEGGAPITPTSTMKGKISWASFIAGCIVVLGGLWSIIVLLISFDLLHLIQVIYLTLFGGLIAAFDAPFPQHPIVKVIRKKMALYVRFCTRVFGRGVAILFLGCTLVAVLWGYDIAPPLSIIFGLPVVIIGVGLIVVSVTKSRKLGQSKSNLVDGGSMSSDIFIKKCEDMQMDRDDAQLLCTALSGDGMGQGVSQQDLDAWKQNPWPMLI